MTMTKGSKIPAAVHWIVVWLSSLLNSEQIVMYTGISVCSVERILQFFKVHGTIDHKDEVCKRRRQYLHDMDIEVCLILSYPNFLWLSGIQFILGAIRDTPDLYIDELQEMLATSCGQTVSRSTVWRVLCRGGFTLKKVCAQHVL